MATRILLRRDTLSNWTSVNPVLLLGEAGYETDTHKLRIGDGSTAFLSLPYLAGDSSSVDIKITVADQTARYALTVSQVQNGDFVFQTDTGVLYEVTDQTNLGNANGYTALATVPWGSVTGKPSTFAPSAHASTHAAAGSDPLTLTKAQISDFPSLGGAASLNVGTTTGTVAAGDDSRLSDSRTPTAAGLASTTHAATSKATPVDADEIPVVDSAASNGLKKLTWANLKATAKSYFDTIYTLANLGGVPSTRTINGVDLSANRSLNDIGAIPEAPSDSKQYARKNGAWAEVVAGAAPPTSLAPLANVKFGLTVGEAITHALPASPAAGDKAKYYIKPTGDKTLDFATEILKPTDSGLTLPKTMTSGKTYVVLMEYNGTAWMLVSLVGGY